MGARSRSRARCPELRSAHPAVARWNIIRWTNPCSKPIRAKLSSLSSRRRLVAVCGESDPRTSLAELAFELGRGIAVRDAVLICGGLTGVMEHAARGARAAGGLTIGLLPGGDVNEAHTHIAAP